MVAQMQIRKRRIRRPLPPGPKLLLLLTIGALFSCATIWAAEHFFYKSDSNNPRLKESGQGRGAAEEAQPFSAALELSDLKEQLIKICNKPQLHAGVFIVEPSSGKFIDLDGRRAYSAASMIKLPVLVALGQALDSKKVSYDQTLVIRDDLIGGGSGWLQWRKPGSKISLRETAELMIIISDNTATNMIIDLLGGKEQLNSAFAQWGLSHTCINNPLPDLPGTNTTSPYDLAFLLGKINQGKILQAETSDWIIKTMARNRIRTLLPMGVPAGTTVANKTGDIASLVGDAAIITTKDGHKYIACVSVERPWNDRRANALIRQVSKEAYIALTGDTQSVKPLDVPASGPERRRQQKHRHRGHKSHHHN